MILLLLLSACIEQPPPLPDDPIAAPPPKEQPAVDSGSEEDGDANQDPYVAKIEITPREPTTDTDLEARIEVTDADGDRVRVKRSWTVNDKAVYGGSGRTLDCKRFEKGDRVQLAVEASDGKVTIGGKSDEVVIRNSPPEILNSPDEMKAIEGLQIRAKDADGDPVRFRIEGAPPGMSIGASDGVLSYEASETASGGDYQVTIFAEDDEGARARWSFGLGVAAGSAAPKEGEAEGQDGAEPAAEEEEGEPQEEEEEEE